MNQIFMDTVENVSPSGGAVTIKFMVMVMAAINSGSLWRDFPKTVNIRHKPNLWSTYLESTILQWAQVCSAEHLHLPPRNRRLRPRNVAKWLARSSWRRRRRRQWKRPDNSPRDGNCGYDCPRMSNSAGPRHPYALQAKVNTWGVFPRPPNFIEE
jgi:hypothetical protein